MTIIAYKKIALESPNETCQNVSSWDGFAKDIESLLKQATGCKSHLGNMWQLALSDGLRLLPKIHRLATDRDVRIAVLVSEDCTISVL